MELQSFHTIFFKVDSAVGVFSLDTTSGSFE